MKINVCRKTRNHKIEFAYNAKQSLSRIVDHLSRVTGTPAFCECKNKGADQLRSNCTANQHLCIRYMDSTNPLLAKSEISSHLLWLYSPLCVGPGRKPQKTAFLTSRLICNSSRETLSSGFPTRSDTNRAVKPQKIVRGFKFRI